LHANESPSQNDPARFAFRSGLANGAAAICELRTAGLRAGNFALQARGGGVKWRCAAVFAAAGVVGALLGASLSKVVDGTRLLALFGLLMLAVAAIMFRRRAATDDA
jgi:hypothetical protein